MTRHRGIHLAVSTADVASLQDHELRTRIANNIHPDRAGDIYVVQAPYWFNFDKGPVTVMHGSPWNYDTHVPIIFMGPGVKPGKVHRQVQPADVVPTLAALLGMTAPASAQGEVLAEVPDRP